jgi:hypothetical protein
MRDLRTGASVVSLPPAASAKELDVIHGPALNGTRGPAGSGAGYQRERRLAAPIRLGLDAECPRHAYL